MSERHAQASRVRWAKVSPEERTRWMREIARIRHGKMSKAEKQEMVAKMTRGRVAKALISNRSDKRSDKQKHDAPKTNEGAGSGR